MAAPPSRKIVKLGKERCPEDEDMLPAALMTALHLNSHIWSLVNTASKTKPLSKKETEAIAEVKKDYEALGDTLKKAITATVEGSSVKNKEQAHTGMNTGTGLNRDLPLPKTIALPSASLPGHAIPRTSPISKKHHTLPGKALHKHDDKLSNSKHRDDKLPNSKHRDDKLSNSKHRDDKLSNSKHIDNKLSDNKQSGEKPNDNLSDDDKFLPESLPQDQLSVDNLPDENPPEHELPCDKHLTGKSTKDKFPSNNFCANKLSDDNSDKTPGHHLHAEIRCVPQKKEGTAKSRQGSSTDNGSDFNISTQGGASPKVETTKEESEEEEDPIYEYPRPMEVEEDKVYEEVNPDIINEQVHSPVLNKSHKHVPTKPPPPQKPAAIKKLQKRAPIDTSQKSAGGKDVKLH